MGRHCYSRATHGILHSVLVAAPAGQQTSALTRPCDLSALCMQQHLTESLCSGNHCGHTCRRGSGAATVAASCRCPRRPVAGSARPEAPAGTSTCFLRAVGRSSDTCKGGVGLDTSYADYSNFSSSTAAFSAGHTSEGAVRAPAIDPSYNLLTLHSSQCFMHTSQMLRCIRCCQSTACITCIAGQLAEVSTCPWDAELSQLCSAS